MEGNIIGFVIWCIIGILFLGLSISAWFSKKPVGFWANVKRPEVSDVKKYNHALSKLLFVFPCLQARTLHGSYSLYWASWQKALPPWLSIPW